MNADIRPRSYEGPLMEQGRRGEQRVLDWIAARVQPAALQDVRDDAEWRRKDVDFLVQAKPGGPWLRFEAKDDGRLSETGNVFFETERIYHDSQQTKLAWSLHTEADFLCVWSEPTGCLYVFRVPAFRSAYYAYVQAHRPRPVLIKTAATCSTVGFPIPLSAFTYSLYAFQDGLWAKTNQTGVDRS